MSDYAINAHDNPMAESKAARAGAAVIAAQSESPRIALFYADDTLLAHVEAALTEAGLKVVCKARVEEVDQTALAASGAAIALINLDDLCDDKLDALSAMLDVAGMPVVFNDAIISRGLDGWARARWARHLAAKLRGSVDVDPPRPAPAVQTPDSQGLAHARGQIAAAIAQADHADASKPAAARPLTQNEIESLLADFPSDSGDASRDADALSAHVDVLLANAADSASNGPASWEVVELAESSAATPQEAPSPFAMVASGPGAWQLVDEPTVFSAPRESVPVFEPATAQSGSVDFELEPIEHVAPALVREREFEEMRLEGGKPARRVESAKRVKTAKSVKSAGKVI